MTPYTGTIVVCDDDQDTLDLVATVLRKAGHTVYLATGHREVVPLIEGTRPDLLLCDIYLPGRNGFQIAEQLRAQGCTTPILFMTAFDMGLYRAYAPTRRTGCIAKPFDPEKLLQHIQLTLRNAAMKLESAFAMTAA